MGRKGGVIHVISINGLLPPTAIHDLGITAGGDIGPRTRVQQLHQPGTYEPSWDHPPTNNSVSPTGRILQYTHIIIDQLHVQ